VTSPVSARQLTYRALTAYDFGVIRESMTALLLIAGMSAQQAGAPRVRISFPQGHFENASMTFGLHHTAGGYSRVYGETMRPGETFFEIGAATDRFKALVWAPGCKMKLFDTPVQTSDVDLRFSCEPLKTITLRGRVKGAKTGKLSVDFTALGTCIWMDGMDGLIRCGGPQIVGIGAAELAADGTFKMELPDFRADPVVSGDSTAELLFSLNHWTLLRPESTDSSWSAIAASHPAEVTFLSGEDLKEAVFPHKSH
jgi:hypothetical protein